MVFTLIQGEVKTSNVMDERQPNIFYYNISDKQQLKAFRFLNTI